MGSSCHFGIRMFLTPSEEELFRPEKVVHIFNYFREIQLINRTAVTAHVANPFWEPNVCIAYEPPGPTIKSWDGVRYYSLID